MMAVEQNMYGVVHEATQKLHDAFEAHINPVMPAPNPEEPITLEVAEPAPVVEAPQTVAQEQSASNKAN